MTINQIKAIKSLQHHLKCVPYSTEKRFIKFKCNRNITKNVTINNFDYRIQKKKIKKTIWKKIFTVKNKTKVIYTYVSYIGIALKKQKYCIISIRDFQSAHCIFYKGMK